MLDPTQSPNTLENDKVKNILTIQLEIATVLTIKLKICNLTKKL